jgi:hypothetical protein
MIETVFVMAIAVTVTAIAVPQSLRGIDEFRTRSAARYLAQRLSAARFDAIKRSAAHGLQFEAVGADYRMSVVADGNRNGLRMSELSRGIDRTLTEPERLDAHFAGVRFGIVDGVPDADGAPSGSSDGVRIGSSKLLSMNADGTATSGTLYVRGTGRSQYAVRVLGSTGRVRILRFDIGLVRWVDLS